ncbi:MAG: c-type cytochrome [Myxococcota bacterium]|jgi:mono/diheme cytochrome c family protein|nr:c-type cytochrome [Myxococcota bacterium]
MHKARFALLSGALLASAAAWAFPWDIDMTDAAFLRAFEWKMMPLPDETVSRDRHRAELNRFVDAEGLQNPLTVDDDVLATGKQMFEVYCATCHGPDGKGGAPVTDMSAGQRYPIPPPLLSGDGSITAFKTDGYLFLTVRDGGAIMPGYGYAMDDPEIWALVAYMRTLDGAAQPTPAEAP